MSQMTIFDSPSVKTKNKIGFLNRWHIRKGDKHVALAVPGEHTVHIHPGKYQNIIDYTAIDLDYEIYEKWMKENGFEEVRR